MQRQKELNHFTIEEAERIQRLRYVTDIITLIGIHLRSEG